MAKTLMTSGKGKSPTMGDLTSDQKKLVNVLMRAGISRISAVMEAIQTIDPLSHKAFKVL